MGVWNFYDLNITAPPNREFAKGGISQVGQRGRKSKGHAAAELQLVEDEIAMKTKGRAARNIAWIEEHCIVPEGALVGQRMKLHEYQRKFLRAIYDAKVPVRRAILSVARKNGK